MAEKKKKETTTKEKNTTKTRENQTETTETTTPIITYKIQVFSSRTLIPKNNSDYRKIANYQPISHFVENGWYKYTCGEQLTLVTLILNKELLRNF